MQFCDNYCGCNQHCRGFFRSDLTRCAERCIGTGSRSAFAIIRQPNTNQVNTNPANTNQAKTNQVNKYQPYQSYTCQYQPLPSPTQYHEKANQTSINPTSTFLTLLLTTVVVIKFARSGLVICRYISRQGRKPVFRLADCASRFFRHHRSHQDCQLATRGCVFLPRKSGRTLLLFWQKCDQEQTFC